jgi:hypothetical protein
MFCPQCAKEYPEGVKTCGDCGVALVAELAANDMDLVPVLVTGEHAELAIAKSLLEAEGIACETEGEAGQETLGAGPLPGATGSVRLLVAREDAEAARDLLAQHEDFAPEDE